MIDGIKITPLKQIFDERGKVMHMLKNDSDVFNKFGEIYFSSSYPGVVKAWHKHREMTLNYAVIFGEIKFVLFDDRSQSPTKGKIQELFISPENYVLVTIPPLIWNGFNVLEHLNLLSLIVRMYLINQMKLIENILLIIVFHMIGELN